MSELVDFSFSLDQLISVHQHQQQQLQQQQQQQTPLRLPMGTCASSVDAGAAAALDDCWDASAYMDGDFLMDNKGAIATLVPELNAANNNINNSAPSFSMLTMPTGPSAVAAGSPSTAAAAAAMSWGMMNGIVGGFADELVEAAEAAAASDDEAEDDDESESSSFSSQQRHQRNHHQQQQLQLLQQEPSQFSQELLNMSVREMHQFVKRSSFTAEQIADLKAERRRMKNRTYARTARCKRKTRQGALETTVQQAQQERQQLLDEVESLRSDVASYKRKLSKAEAQLRNAGIAPAW